ncbi:MAG: hypothetical protein IPN19_12775 [Elusimicrobia bacterium]|nr:hypothetical protein [Elusimicrobiota bacterium]
MGRPAGSKNKKTEVVEDVVIPEVSEQKESEVISHEEERKETAKAIVLKPKLEPLGPGQKYFESPDGVILIGEETSPSLWYRAGNGGKGMWINPKR